MITSSFKFDFAIEFADCYQDNHISQLGPLVTGNCKKFSFNNVLLCHAPCSLACPT